MDVDCCTVISNRISSLSSGLVLAPQHPLSCRQAIKVTAASATSGLAFT